MNNELEANKKHFSKSHNQQLILLSQTAGETDHEENTVASFLRRGAHDLNLGQGLLYYLP